MKIFPQAEIIFKKTFRPVGASRLPTSGAVARVTRDALFSIFTTAVFLRGFSPADECAS